MESFILVSKSAHKAPFLALCRSTTWFNLTFNILHTLSCDTMDHLHTDDYSRVKLLQISGKGKDTDYINASYIDVCTVHLQCGSE